MSDQFAYNKGKYAVTSPSGEVFTFVMADNEEALDVVKDFYPAGSLFFDMEKY